MSRPTFLGIQLIDPSAIRVAKVDGDTVTIESTREYASFDLSNMKKATTADFYATTPDPRINRRTIAAALRGRPLTGPVPKRDDDTDTE